MPSSSVQIVQSFVPYAPVLTTDSSVVDTRRIVAKVKSGLSDGG